MKPSVGVLLQVELTGVPLDMKQVLKAKAKLNLIKDKWQSIIMNSKEVVEYTDILRKKALDKDFEARRNKAKKPEGIKEKDRPKIKSPRKIHTLPRVWLPKRESTNSLRFSKSIRITCFVQSSMISHSK